MKQGNAQSAYLRKMKRRADAENMFRVSVHEDGHLPFRCRNEASFNIANASVSWQVCY
jgi:hypothetical protein